jgi:hypothetical protein
MFNKWWVISASLGLSFYSLPLLAELMDPTAPSDYVKEAPKENKKMASGASDFVLSAVLTSDDTRMAIVNNTVVKVGDKIGDSVVKSIDDYSVKLSGSQGVFEIRLFANEIKEPEK